MQITTAPAQVGNGRTVHRVRTDGFHSKTLCGRTADRCLGESDLKKMRGSCIRCSERLGELLADQPEAVAEAPVEEPTHYTVECAIVQAHPGYREDRIGVRIAGEEDASQLIALPRTADWSTLSVLRAFGWEAEQLDYVASLNLVRGTVRIIEPETCEAAQEIQQAVRREITARLTVRLSSGAAAHFRPVTADSSPYPIGWTYRIGYGERAFFGAVTAGGTLVAPAGVRTREDAEGELRTADPAAAPYNEVLHAYVSGLPAEELGRHFLAARNGSLNTLPDTLTAGAPITVQQARDLVTRTYASAEEFEAFQGEGGRFLGWTFRSGRLHSSRYGWITGRGTLTPALEPYRSEAGNVLVHADRDDQEAAERATVARSMTGRKLAENRCVHNRYTRSDVQGDPVLACTMKAGGDTFAVFTDEGAAEVFDCAVEAANEAARMGGWDEYEGADPLPFWAKTCPEHAEEVAGRCELCGQDTPEEDAEEEPEAADSPEADATVTALPFHGPDGYTGPRAVCSYDDHTAPAREDGTVEDHERTAGLMGSCPGSLLAARSMTSRKLAGNRCVHHRYTRSDVQGDPVLACETRAPGETFGLFTAEGLDQTHECAVEVANEAARMGGWDTDVEGAEPLPYWAKTCPTHREGVAGRCALCGQDTPDEDAEEAPAPRFVAGDLVVCADGVRRTAEGMAPRVTGEPERVIVEGGAEWIADNCRRANRDDEHRTTAERAFLYGQEPDAGRS